jgi:hypothetical protein
VRHLELQDVIQIAFDNLVIALAMRFATEVAVDQFAQRPDRFPAKKTLHACAPKTA